MGLVAAFLAAEVHHTVPGILRAVCVVLVLRPQPLLVLVWIHRHRDRNKILLDLRLDSVDFVRSLSGEFAHEEIATSVGVVGCEVRCIGLEGNAVTVPTDRDSPGAALMIGFFSGRGK